MIEFLEPAKPFRPFKIRFWNRAYGPEFASFELSLMKEFYNASKMRRIDINGYVRRVDTNHFILLPTLHTSQIHMLCTCPDGVPLPPENAYINVEGSSHWDSRHITRITGDRFLGEKAIAVEKWKIQKPDWISQIKPNINFHDFEDEVFSRIVNIEPLIKELLIYQLISCPRFEVYTGGLNLCTYDSTNKKVVHGVIEEIKRIVPSEMFKPHNIQTSIGRVQLFYNYRFLPISADKPLRTSLINFMKNRTATYGPNEISLSMGSKKSSPASLEDPPFALSDFPTILNEEVEIFGKKGDPSLEAFKFMLVQHLRTPIIDNSQDIISKVFDNITRLQERYDLSPEILGRFKILDASYYGKPQSVLRLALANARLGTRGKVTTDNLNFALERFNKNFDNTYETWLDLYTEAEIPFRAKVLLKLSPDERNIIRVIEKLQDRYGCATVDEISSELPAIKKYILRQLLEDLEIRKGLIIRKFLDCYRVIPWK